VSGLLKQGVGRAVRGLETATRPAAEEAVPAVDPVALALREAAAAAIARAEAAEAEIPRLEEAAREAYAEGRKAGVKAGLRQAEDARAESLKRRDAGIAEALASYRDELSAMERLAALLAREALERIVGDPERHVEMLCAIIRRQVEAVDAAAVLRIEVSREDHCEALGEAAGGVEVVVADALRSGECRMKMQLGTLEIGVAEQWGRMRSALDELAEAPQP